jgi:deazaflavin-dependent oxidoreductase (nitroreductase family)
LYAVPEDPNPYSGDLFGQEHVRAYRETGGERGYHWRGTTILLLTTTGRVSGKERTTPLIFDNDHGDAWVVVASKGGSPDDPDWYKNLLANPEGTLQVKNKRFPVRAEIAGGDERARLWRRMTKVWPDYDQYQKRTDREIPVVVFRRR